MPGSQPFVRLTEAGDALDIAAGGKITDDGVQAAAIVDMAAALPPAAPAGGAGAAAGGWDTAANRDLAITTINDLRTLVGEMRTKNDAIYAALRGAGIIVP